MKNHLILLTFLISILFGCKPSEEKKIHQRIEDDTLAIYDSLVKIRRDFHQHPELAGNEIRTSKIVAEYLSGLGLEVKTGVAGNGVIGILKGSGKGKGKTIAWRADMDALPNNFPDEEPYRSIVEGVHHGCGHDFHMAIGLGIAEVLAENKDAINGTICFIFQPEEETFLGAKNIAESSEFENLNLDEIYGLHIAALPLGQIIVKPKEVFAYQKGFQLTFDATFSKDNAKSLYDQLRREFLRKEDGTDPWDISKAFVDSIGLTNPNTVFRDYLFLEEHFVFEENDDQVQIRAYLYETNKNNLPSILPKMEALINNSEFTDKFIASSYIQENPTVLNDADLTSKSIKTLNDIYGKETVLMDYGQIPYFNDDFCYFQQKTPGVYFLFGGSNPEKDIFAMNHAPNFRVDEDCIKTGVSVFSSLVLERANSK